MIQRRQRRSEVQTKNCRNELSPPNTLLVLCICDARGLRSERCRKLAEYESESVSGSSGANGPERIDPCHRQGRRGQMRIARTFGDAEWCRLRAGLDSSQS